MRNRDKKLAHCTKVEVKLGKEANHVPNPSVMTIAAASDMKQRKADPTASTKAPNHC